MKRNFSIFTGLMMALTLGLALFVTPSFTTPTAAQVAPPASAEEAKRELARLASTNLSRIKDAKVRNAAQRVVAALQAVANNRDARKEAALIQTFETSLANVNTEASQSAEYQTKAFKCNDDRQKCKAACPKTFCGCGVSFLTCLVVG